MSNPKGRTVPDVLNIYLIMLGVYCLDLFFLKSDLSVLGDNFYARFVSFVILFVLLWVRKTSVDVLGITKKKKKIATGIVYGIIFSVVPLVFVTAIECIYYGFTDITALDLRFAPPSLSYVKSTQNMTPAIAIIIYIFSTFFGSAFKEFFFRGYVLRKLKTVYDFKSANLVQALLYTSLIVPYLLRNLLNHYYDDTTTELGVFIVMFYLIHETLAGIKWGLITRVTGSTYTAVIDHFLYVFLANSVFITNRYVTWSFMTHMLAIQVASLILVLIYYNINMKKLIAKKAKEEEEAAARRAARSQRHKDGDYSDVIDQKIQDIDSISPDQYKDIVEQATPKHHSSHQHSRLHNEKNSQLNADKIENIDTASASTKADEYLTERLHNSHIINTSPQAEKINADKIENFNGDVHIHSHSETEHIHHHREVDSEKIEEINSQKIENLSPEEIEKKAAQYSDSLSIERAIPKHPHPHDTMARDSLLPVEEIEKANADKIGNFNDEAIDDFLESFNQELSKTKKHHSHRTVTEEFTDDKIDSIDENFNADKFLNDFQHNRLSPSENSSNQQRRHHHHHHNSDDYRSEDDIASLDEINTNNFYEEYQKTSNENKQHSGRRRRSFIQAVKDLGEIDDSDSNELI
jgi:membrane protease YdiL (CAAX protease family)